MSTRSPGHFFISTRYCQTQTPSGCPKHLYVHIHRANGSYQLICVPVCPSVWFWSSINSGGHSKFLFRNGWLQATSLCWCLGILVVLRCIPNRDFLSPNQPYSKFASQGRKYSISPVAARITPQCGKSAPRGLTLPILPPTIRWCQMLTVEALPWA